MSPSLRLKALRCGRFVAPGPVAITPRRLPPPSPPPKRKGFRRTDSLICRPTARTCNAGKSTGKRGPLFRGRGRGRFGWTRGRGSRIRPFLPEKTRSPTPRGNAGSPDSPFAILTTAACSDFTPDDSRRGDSSPSDSQTRPASIAPSGGNRALLGTNPFSLAVPDLSDEAGGAGGSAILIDQSASVVAKSEVMKRAREGRELPPGWALDADGNPTTDADAALRGTMAPSGGYKGVGLALLTETMAAVLTGANLGIEASPFSGTAGGPPGTGQFFLALDPVAFGDSFGEKLSGLREAFAGQPGARVPGSGRAAARARAMDSGVEVAGEVLAKARELAGD